jgi:hypothetical protein
VPRRERETHVSVYLGCVSRAPEIDLLVTY